MTHITDEDLRDELLTIFEDKEEELKSHEEAMKNVEDEAMMAFERRVIAIKNRVVQDIAIPEEKLEEACLEEIEKMRKELVAEVEQKVSDYLKTIEERAKVTG
jgi:hypothetical protein